MSNWLEKKIKDYNSNNIYYYITSNNEIYDYYNYNDVELERNYSINNEDSQYYLYIDKNNVEKVKKITIPLNTNRGQADMLFRVLIDYCKKKNYKYKGKYLINKNMRAKFYRFCKKHTKHT